MAVAINTTIEKCVKRGLRRNTEIFYLASYGRWLGHNSVPSDPLFWTSRLQLLTSRKLSPTCPWTSEKNPYFHTPDKGQLFTR